jgi:hypothetical protein
MGLSVIHTYEEPLVGAAVVGALRQAVEEHGAAVLLVPSFAQGLEAQRALARHRGLALAVTTTTPAAWVRERWEVWGDGRSIADPTVLALLSRQAIAQADADELGPIELSAGIVDLLARLVGQALPWLPIDESRQLRPTACADSGLTHAETRLVGLAAKVGRLMDERGYVGMAEASASVPRVLAESGAQLRPDLL